MARIPPLVYPIALGQAEKAMTSCPFAPVKKLELPGPLIPEPLSNIGDVDRSSQGPLGPAQVA